jgi:DtxR family Mn-dependent transcriptional regulator
MDVTSAIQDYLKNIYRLQAHYDQVPTNALAERLGVSAPSVTSMVGKLDQLGLLKHERYKGVKLTPKGETLALKALRAHRLWELYLVEALDLPWDQAHIEAERLDHALSNELADRLDEVLGHPAVDPHGQPIPSRNGTVIPRTGMPLTELAPGDAGRVLLIRDDTPELLRYLGELGVYPGEPIRVLEVTPFDGPIHVQIGQESHALGRKAAEQVIVQTEETEDDHEK